MGQYHMPVCVDTMEQINPHRFGEMVRIGITGEVKPTKAQAKELLAAIAEAEELAKATKP